MNYETSPYRLHNIHKLKFLAETLILIKKNSSLIVKSVLYIARFMDLLALLETSLLFFFFFKHENLIHVCDAILSNHQTHYRY